MKLYVMRHGPAEDEAPDGLDSSRALTIAGRERVRQVGKALDAIGESPKVVVSSPLVRALQTAEIVHQALAVPGAVEATRALAPRGPAIDLVRGAAASGRRRLMVVGHEPDLSLLVAQLLGAPLSHGFMKAMIVSLRVTPGDAGEASLRFVLEPKTLQLLVDHRGATKPATES